MKVSVLKAEDISERFLHDFNRKQETQIVYVKEGESYTTKISFF